MRQESDSTMILKDLKDEDSRRADEISKLTEYEDKIYNLKFKTHFEFPLTRDGIKDQTECFSVRFEKYDNLIGAGYSNGYVCVFDMEGGKPKYMKASDYPITCIRWKPHMELRPKNILVSVTADGKITHWHTASGKALHSMEEVDNPIMCLDYNIDGSLFATGGSDKHVRLYDDNTKTLLRIMKPGNFNQPGHSNRVFSINFHKDNPCLMASGGWDNTIQFYDVKQGTIINSIYGPHICGDSIDMKGDYLLTGSWSIKDQLQIWDIRTFKLVQNVYWEKDELFNSTYIYISI